MPIRNGCFRIMRAVLLFGACGFRNNEEYFRNTYKIEWAEHKPKRFGADQAGPEGREIIMSVFEYEMRVHC